MATILIIDDDKDFVESNKLLLESNGYSVITAHNGTDGFVLARKEQPDLMLLDVMMKHDTEGFDVVRKLNKDKHTKDLPVIIITGIRKAKTLPFRFEPDEDWLPVKAVLEKPVLPQVLLDKVKSFLM